MKKRYGIISHHPDFDWAIASLGGKEVPTKQDKFKPLLNSVGIEKLDDGSETIYDNLYVKNPNAEDIKEFEINLKEFVRQNLKPEHPYKKPQKLEVILSINTTGKRFFQVDVDNLAKYILDCLNGLVYEDDTQIVRLLVMKEQFVTNGLIIGIIKVDENKKGWFGDTKLLFAKEEEREE